MIPVDGTPVGIRLRTRFVEPSRLGPSGHQKRPSPGYVPRGPSTFHAGLQDLGEFVPSGVVSDQILEHRGQVFRVVVVLHGQARTLANGRQ